MRTRCESHGGVAAYHPVPPPPILVGKSFAVKVRCATGAVMLIAFLLIPTRGLSQSEITVTVTGFGHIVEVFDKTHVLVNRGRAERLLADDRKNGIYPIRQQPGANLRVADSGVLLAEGHVVELGEHTAKLELSKVNEPVDVGDGFSYFLEVPASLTDEVLTELARMDITFTKLDSGQPYYQLSALLADSSPGPREAVITQMLKEIHAAAAEGQNADSKQIEGGLFAGKTLDQALADTTRENVLGFLDYARVINARFVAQSRVLVNSYASWILNGSPNVSAKLAERKARPHLERGDDFASKGEFEEAEREYQEARRILPSYATAEERLKSVDDVRVLNKLLQKDPGSTRERWDLMNAYLELGAQSLALAELDRLDQVGYEPERSREYRALILFELKRYREAAAVLRDLLGKHPGDHEDIDAEARKSLLEYVETRERLQAAPDSPAALLAMGHLKQGISAWQEAIAYYQDALRAAKTPEEEEEAKTGLNLTKLLRVAAQQARFATENVREHDIAAAQVNLAQLRALCKQASAPRCVAQNLKDVVHTASEVKEDGLAIVLARERAERDPKSEEAQYDLAIYYYGAGRMAEAMAAVESGLDLEPASPAGRYIRAKLNLLAGNLKAAREDAGIVARARKDNYVPDFILGEIAAADGDFDEALRKARDAEALDPEKSRVKELLSAAQRGASASAELRAGTDIGANQLRLMRSLIELDLAELALRQLPALRGTPQWWREANWIVANVDPAFVPLAVRLAAARAAEPETLSKKRWLRVLEMQAALEQSPDDPETRVELARAQVATGSFHRALATLGELPARPDATPARDVAQMAREGLAAEAAKAEADRALTSRDLPKAERLFRLAVESFRKIGDLTDAVYSTDHLIGVLVDLHRDDEVRALSKSVLEEAAADGGPLRRFAVEWVLAEWQESVGNLDAKVKVLAQIPETSGVGGGDEELLAMFHRERAGLASDQGRYSEALREAQEASRYAQLAGNPSEVRSALGVLAGLKMDTQDLSGCQSIADDLLTQSRRARDAINERHALMLLGDVAMRRGDWKAALEFYDEVYRLGVRKGNDDARALALLNEAHALLRAAHEPQDAISKYKQAAEIYENLNEQYMQARSLLGTGQGPRGGFAAEPGSRDNAQTSAAAVCQTRPSFRPGAGFGRACSAASSRRKGQRGARLRAGSSSNRRPNRGSRRPVDGTSRTRPRLAAVRRERKSSERVRNRSESASGHCGPQRR